MRAHVQALSPARSPIDRNCVRQISGKSDDASATSEIEISSPDTSRAPARFSGKLACKVNAVLGISFGNKQSATKCYSLKENSSLSLSLSLTCSSPRSATPGCEVESTVVTGYRLKQTDRQNGGSGQDAIPAATYFITCPSQPRIALSPILASLKTTPAMTDATSAASSSSTRTESATEEDVRLPGGGRRPPRDSREISRSSRP